MKRFFLNKSVVQTRMMTANLDKRESFFDQPTKVLKMNAGGIWLKFSIFATKLKYRMDNKIEATRAWGLGWRLAKMSTRTTDDGQNENAFPVYFF